jgi:hypothetical protein
MAGPASASTCGDEMDDHFGLDPVRCGTDPVAGKLLAWYAAEDQGR